MSTKAELESRFRLCESDFKRAREDHMAAERLLRQAAERKNEAERALTIARAELLREVLRG